MVCDASELDALGPGAIEVLPTEAGYDRWAEIYDGEDNPLVLLEAEHIGSLIGEIKGLAVADIGCGTGRHALHMANSGARVTAVDFSEAMLSRAQEKPGAEKITFVRHDLSKPLPLEEGAFDRVLCCLVLDHIENVDQFFSELHRVCRAGGYVIVSVVHPAMLLRGVQARFTDPVSGRRLSPLSHAHQISDYVMAAARGGLKVERMSEHVVDETLAERSPRARKYLNWPVLLLMRLRP
jgi:malonyl-CoA O-methyltransferase